MRPVVCRRASSSSSVWEERYASIEQFSKAWPEPKSPQVQRQLKALDPRERWLEREFSRPDGSKAVLQVKYSETADTVRQSAAPKRQASTFVRANAKRARSKFSLSDSQKTLAERDATGMPSWEPVDEQLDDDAPAELQLLSKFACAKFSCSYAASQLSQQQLPDQAAAL